MAQGTLSVTNNSTAVVGVGTKFTDYAPGSFITLNLVGVPYTIAVDTVTDDTNLVLLVPFDGPTTTGASFDVTGVNTMALATMGVTVQAQKALRMLLTDQANWRQIFSNEPSITITLPNGQTLTGMSWGYISQQLADIDIDQMIAVKNEAVAARDDAVAAKGDAETAATTATGAATTATGAATTATNAADTATTAAGTAASDAASANADADRAEAAANSVDPSNLLHKDQNLADLGDKQAAWLNVRPEGATPLAADAIADGDAPRWKQVKDFIAAVRTVLSSWSVVNADTSAPANGTTVKGGAVRSVYKVGAAEYGAAELKASVATSSAGVSTVGAEVVVTNSTSGSAVSYTVTLPAVDSVIPALGTANTWGATQTIKSPLVVAIDAPANPVGGQLINSPVLRMRVNGRGANSDAMGEVGDIFLQEKVGTYVALTFNISAFSDNKFWSMNASTGETFSPLGTLAVQGSDVRIKYNFTSPKLGAWGRVEAIGICEYMYNGSIIPQRGFLAQQMGGIDSMYVFESSISTAKDSDGKEFNILNVNDRAVMADMITVIQELQQKVTDLQSEIAELKNK